MRRVAIAIGILACAAASGCIKWQKTGMVEAPIAAKETVPVVCIEDRGGRDAQLLEGEAAGKRAVSASEVRTGFAPTMAEPVTVDGAEVFAAQSCVMLGEPVCDNALYTRKGERRYFLYWSTKYKSADAVPASTQLVVDEFRRQGVLASLQQVDVDDATARELAELSRARRARQRWNVVKFAVGMALQQGASKLGVAEGVAKEQGAKLVNESLDVRFEIDDSEKPALEKNPKLAAMFATAKLAAGGSDFKVASFCVGPAKASP